MYYPGTRDGVLQEYGKHVTRIGIRIYIMNHTLY